MRRARPRRLVKIQEKPQNAADTPQVMKFLATVRNTQHRLSHDIFVIPTLATMRHLIESPEPVKSLLNAFDDLIRADLLKSPNAVFESIDSINKVFNRLIESFKLRTRSLELHESYKTLCEGLQLVIEWYRVQAIEAYLYKPLDNELVVKEYKYEENTLQDKGKLLANKIKDFNAQLEERDLVLDDSQLPNLDLKETDLTKLLQPLLAEESRLGKIPDQSLMVDTFKQERFFLEEELKTYNKEVEIAIGQIKITLANRKARRENLYQSQLGIDVYYLDDFRKQNNAIFTSYEKLINNKQRDELLKVEKIEKLIIQLSEPFRKFDLALAAFYANTSSVWHVVSPNLHVINGIHQLLKDQLETCKKTSLILKLETEYAEPFQALHNGVLDAKKIVEDDFVKASTAYLSNLAAYNIMVRSDIKEKADDAYEDEVEFEISKVKPLQAIPAISEVQSAQFKKQRLDQRWIATFEHILLTEIEDIKREFYAIGGNKASDLVALRKIEDRLKNKRDAIEAIIGNQCPELSNTLNDAYLRVFMPPVMLEVKERIAKLNKSAWTTLAVDEHKSSSVNIGTFNPKIEKKSPWYAKFIDQPWKRAVCYGVLTFALILGIISLWGVVVEVSSLTILSALMLGGASGVVVGVTSYIADKCCCKDSGDVLDLHQIPMNNPFLPKPTSSHGGGMRFIPKILRATGSQTVSPPASEMAPANPGGLGLFDRGADMPPSAAPVPPGNSSILRKGAGC